VAKLAENLRAKGNSASYALSKASSEIISKQIHITAIPKRFTIPMREIWDLQLQLPRRGGQRAKRLAENPRFRAGYDFILLREQAGEELNGLGQWWTKYQEANPEEQQQMADEVGKTMKKRRRSRGPRKKKTSEA
jgi:poly(A) polymerase